MEKQLTSSQRILFTDLIDRLIIGHWQGAATTCYVALSRRTDGISGSYFEDCNESQCSAMANDKSQSWKLWKQTRALIHRRLPIPAGQNLEIEAS